MFSKKNIVKFLSTVALTAVMTTSAFAAKPKFVFKFGTIVPGTHADCIAANKVFKKSLEEGSNGRIKFELYPNAQLGGDREMVEACQLGVLDGCLPAGSTLVGFDKRFQMLALPYLFRDRETAFKSLDGKVGQTLNSHLPEIGLVGLGFTENGFRHVSNNRGPINTPEDMKGIKLRTMENPMHLAYFKAIGANPTPMAWGELYTALQQGVVDGEENPAALVNEARFYEVQKYYSKTGHVFSACDIIVSKVFFDSLPEDLQKVLIESAKKYAAAQRKEIIKQERESFEALKENGMILNEISPENREKFAELAAPLYSQFKEEIGDELYQMAMELQKNN
ncbi:MULTISPECIES: TRAP transporter substrate-binding protein [Dethiosulfovibrio]|uniref:TRAP transporter substrate-binding protein n=2 Tax=Dethiosulfovibrio TaxID=47054 RepID=A0ABS9EPQ2_9BACT|nr:MULTISPECIES: TRAP transporter substrate-binding protein [Dethiosulfovibrio]MCF4114136.1 TRAP transporter substrate-binding protein [Dethiosulfovibrio russensis]MCF4142674.1 TRAP transporter substrate-binding protein [Dethiosulfovibrio marinus]MCF4144762.1 TRAP transporter substrate-binding protein [Dethiosulfovibrio acidaminovorans]